MAPGGGGAHTGGGKKQHNLVTSETEGGGYFLDNMRKATPYLVSWEVPQDPLEGKTQAVAARRGPCEERDHPWGQVGVPEEVVQASVDQLQVKAEVTHTHTQ